MPALSNAKSWVKDNLLLLATLSGVIVGVVLGLSLRPCGFSEKSQRLVQYPGELFMRLLKLMIVPLVIASLITGSASLNARMNGKIAARTVVYFVITSLINSILGTVLVLLIHPGSPDMLPDREHSNKPRADIRDSLMDLGRNVFPDNLFQATFEQTQTHYRLKDDEASEYKAVAEYHRGTNTLGIIFFCIVFGTVLGTLGQRARVVIQFFAVIDDVIMKMVSGIMWTSPVGIASIICGKILQVDDLPEVMEQLALFILTVIVGVFIYQLIIMQLIYLVIVRKNPWRFFWSLRDAWFTVFATASTAATLPISLRCVEEKAGVDRRVSRFVLPIGATVNMDGTAMFVAISALFIAQMNNMEISMGMLVNVCLTATAASVASASVPSAALVLLVLVVQAIDVPVPDITLLFAVDWLVDRFRSTNNCLGDCYTAAVVAHLSRDELAARSSDEAQEGISLEEAEKSPLSFTQMNGNGVLPTAVVVQKTNGAPIVNSTDM